MPIKIDKNIPVPLSGKCGEIGDTVDKMAIGDSVFVTTIKEYNVWRNRINNRGYKAVGRKEGKGWRVWKCDHAFKSP
jgi:hypothetical protein